MAMAESSEIRILPILEDPFNVLTSMSLIGKELYVCMGNNGMSVYNLDLVHRRDVPEGDMGKVFDVTDLNDGSLVVAASEGLYHRTDGVNKQITPDSYTSVTRHDERVYAASTSNNIHMFTRDEEGVWNRLATNYILRCTDDHSITLAATSDVLYAVCRDDNCVYELDAATGEVLQTHGIWGSTAKGVLCGPRAAHITAAQELLVCDVLNHRLQVLSRDGTWRVVLKSPQVWYPHAAVYTQGKYYVAPIDSEMRRKFPR